MPSRRSPPFALGVLLSLSPCLWAADDPAWYVRKDTWHATMQASLQAVQKQLAGTTAAGFEPFTSGVIRGRDPAEHVKLRVAGIQQLSLIAKGVPNRQYARFDPDHDSRFESKNGYQFGVTGFALDAPNQPVVRVSWERAMAFCQWLSEQTGEPFTLPTEAQWEYACRAGSDSPFWYGGRDTDFSPFANVADGKLRDFVTHPYTVYEPLPDATRYDDWIPRDNRFDDGGLVTVDVAAYQPNAWGLHEMHGNVAEWTLTTYRPYPYDPHDGRDDPQAEGRKVVRGGSWCDRPARSRSAFRLSYHPWQGVYNVGFRVTQRRHH